MDGDQADEERNQLDASGQELARIWVEAADQRDRLRAQIRRMCGPSMTTAELERALGLEPGDLGEEADRG